MSATIASDTLGKECLQAIADKIIRERGTGGMVKVQTINPSTTVVHISSGPSVEIEYHCSPSESVSGLSQKDAPYLYLQIKNYRVGYRQAPRVIRNEVMPILEMIMQTVGASVPKYSFTIGFGKGQNPFWGLYLTHLPPTAVSRFVVNLRVDDYEQNDTVLVSDSKIAINTHSQHALQKLALDYLTFGANLRGEAA